MSDDDEGTDDLVWETLGTETAYTCPGFDIYTDTVRLPDGTETEFDYLSEPESVVIVPFTPDGEVVLVEEWRHSVGRVNRGFPAGGVEPDDTNLETTARRELAEETGYVAGELNRLTTVEPANGFSDAVFTYFLAEDCRPDGQQDLDHNESIRVTTVDFQSLRAAVADDELRDGRTALGVLYVAAVADVPGTETT